MKINNRKELYEYLDSIDYSKYKESSMSDVYFIVTEEYDKEYVVTFISFEGEYFECPQQLIRIQLSDDELEYYVKDIYEDKYFKEALEYEKKFQFNGFHYEIDGYQTDPWIEKLVDIKPITETECFDFMLRRSGL